MPADRINWATVFGFFLGLLVFGLPILLMYVSIPWQARKRGYSYWIWQAACIVNVAMPLHFLVLLSLLPNRSRIRLREKFRAELDAKLANISRPQPSRESVEPIPPGSTATVARSLGDMPTIVPRERSIGDDETRG